MATEPAPTISTLGRFEVLEEIGRGASGVVFLARDPVIGRLVALKSLRTDKGQDAGELGRAHEMFIEEAKTVGLLAHPNIVAIHDVGREEGSAAPFLAMEYVPGVPLERLLAGRQPLPFDQTTQIISAAAEALDHAHERGVVHRDVKPSHLIVADDGSVKLTDFGIASSTESPSDEHSFGSPAYVSPERVLGQTVDHRADLFALGVVLYEMLTGQLPFQARTAQELLQRIAHEPVRPPDELGVHLPAELLAILDRALAKDPDERYQQAGKLAADVSDAVARISAHKAQTDTRDLTPLRPAAPAPPTTPTLAARVHELARRCRARGRRWLATRPTTLSPFRVGSLAGITGVACLLLGWLAFALVPHVDPPPADDAVALRLGRQYVDLMKEGRTHLRAGRPEAAERAFALAGLLAEDRPAPEALRRVAAREVAELADYRSVEERVVELLAEAYATAESGRLTQARQLLDSVLELDPERTAAHTAIGELDDRLDRRRAASRQATIVEPAAEIAPPPTPAPVAAETPPVQIAKPTGPARLTIDLENAGPRGTVMVYDDEAQVLRQAFRSTRRLGLLRRKAPTEGFRIERQFEPGRRVLRIYVSLPGAPTKLRSIPVELDPGTIGVVKIRITEDREISVAWVPGS